MIVVVQLPPISPVVSSSNEWNVGPGTRSLSSARTCGQNSLTGGTVVLVFTVRLQLGLGPQCEVLKGPCDLGNRRGLGTSRLGGAARGLSKYGIAEKESPRAQLAGAH